MNRRPRPILAVAFLSAAVTLAACAKTANTADTTPVAPSNANSTDANSTDANSTDANSTDAASTTPADTSTASRSVTLVAYDSFALTDIKFSEFTEKTGIAVKVLTSGDTGEMVNKAVLTKDAPLGDVMWGVDNTFLDRALSEKLFTKSSVDTSNLDPALVSLVPGKEVVPVDTGDVCVNYDKAALAKAGVQPPATFDDLTKPEYKNMLVVQNPATSSPGLAFLLGTIAAQPTSWKETWAKLKSNGVLVVNGWTEAYETYFSAGGGGGDRPLVVSYGTSPAAAVLYGPDPKASESPTGVAEGTCFRQIEFAGVLSNSKHQEDANMLLEYLIGPSVQKDIQLSMFVYPSNTKTAVAEAFAKFATKPASPNQLPPAKIATSRDTWIDEWTKIVL